MKKKLLIAGVILAAGMNSSFVYANDIGVAICKSVIGNDKHGLRLALRSGNLKLRSIYKDLRCNDKSLIQLALENSADDVGTYIISKVAKSTLDEVNDLGWAESNGFTGSAIYTELKNRVD
ncbi:DUF3718 domain-containing protein [Catenovulum sp. 2E275]|uniref:DUF3718 domain-containing protein n=1 Tax=Catenovulum sp. 2E275 TaxID=2980497 RepID=UPI0021D1E41E|nr:DUF3718 domain-containing protein [Catenovulum sp. 2E275]MCU4674583.1 DUF3718 domain-containing protein [Catenovulum sp. 2E275]